MNKDLWKIKVGFFSLVKISLNEIMKIKSFISYKDCKNISNYCDCSYLGVDSLISPRP